MWSAQRARCSDSEVGRVIPNAPVGFHLRFNTNNAQAASERRVISDAASVHPTLSQIPPCPNPCRIRAICG
jgi:hypothetical protein